MKKLSFGLFIVMIFCLSVATFVEKFHGTDYVYAYIYSSWWFVAFWMLLVIAAFIYLLKKKVYKLKAVFMLHCSFAVILVGAFLTFTTGIRGNIHLRQGEPANSFIEEKAGEIQELPFVLVLDSFQIDYYAGTHAPADYLSKVHLMEDNETIHQVISMNNILSHNGYRFYQNSFDKDLRGTYLSVNYDHWGIPVTYGGYLLLALSMVWILFSHKSEFWNLLHHPLLKQVSILFLLFFFSEKLSASPSTIDKEEAKQFGTVQMLYNNRVCPVQTFARDFTLKVTGKAAYKEFSPEQVLAGWIFFPQKWQYEPMIKVKSEELQRLLGVKEKACFRDFFTSKKEYRLAAYWSQLHQGGKQSSLLKAITEVDEKVQLIVMLQQGTLISFFPCSQKGDIQWFSPISELPVNMTVNQKQFIRGVFTLLYETIEQGEHQKFSMLISKIKSYQQKEGGLSALSENKVKAELLYNRIDFSTLLYRINLTLGLLAFIFFFIKAVPKFFSLLLLCSFLFHSFGMFLRAYISGRFPMSNGYETMLFVAECIMLIALLFRHKFSFITAFGLLLSGFALLVASLGQMNPQITPLMPVLSSPWLSLHVSFIMVSYSLFGFMMLNGLTAILLSLFGKRRYNEKNSEQIERLAIISRLFLYPATFFLGIGIFIGAVWANVSWGRYWSWDPKEVWALITLMVYALAFHTTSLVIFRKAIFFHLFMIIAFCTVLMTYFGVNYFLGGMHSYAG